jgi:siroheme synthase-like protein
MNYYPVFLDLHDRKCLVVGLGKLAEEKLAALNQAGARVVHQPHFQEEEAADCWLIVASVDERAEMDRIRDFAEARRIPLNVIDQTEHCSFIAPAIMRRDDLVIAVSTSGQCPALASRIREHLEHEYGPEYALLLRVLGEIRPRVKSRLGQFEQRRAFYHHVLDLDPLTTLRQSGEHRLRERLYEALESYAA